MSDIPCPSCGGSKQLQIVHVSQLLGLCAGVVRIETDVCGMSSESQPKTGQERDAMASEIRKAIEPVADWFDVDGEEGDPIPLVEVVSEIAKMLAEERQDTLRYRKALQDIIKHQEIVAGPSMARMSTTIRIAKKALQDDGQ